LIKKLIGAGGRDSCGRSGQMRPRRSDSYEEAHRPPHGKPATWSGNQLISLFKKEQILRKQPFHKIGE